RRVHQQGVVSGVVVEHRKPFTELRETDGLPGGDHIYILQLRVGELEQIENRVGRLTVLAQGDARHRVPAAHRNRGQLDTVEPRTARRRRLSRLTLVGHWVCNACYPRRFTIVRRVAWLRSPTFNSAGVRLADPGRAVGDLCGHRRLHFLALRSHGSGYW